MKISRQTRPEGPSPGLLQSVIEMGEQTIEDYGHLENLGSFKVPIRVGPKDFLSELGNFSCKKEDRSVS